jgi:hypothetical protein
VANRSKGRRGRTRKPRPNPDAAQRPAAPAGAAAEAAGPAPGRGRPARARRDSAAAHGRGAAAPAKPGAGAAARGLGGLGELQPLGERPEAPWHPLPLSELLILIGAVGVIVGLLRGVHLDGPEQISGSGGPTLVAGIVAVLLGTIEVTLREHRSGYRSHTLLLAVLPPIAVYSIAVLVVSAFTTFPRWLNIPLLIIVVGLFVFLWKVLRTSFRDARRERRFAGRR